MYKAAMVKNLAKYVYSSTSHTLSLVPDTLVSCSSCSLTAIDFSAAAGFSSVESGSFLISDSNSFAACKILKSNKQRPIKHNVTVSR